MPTPLQNENSMNVHLSKSDLEMPVGVGMEELPHVETHEALDRIRSVPRFDLESEKYGHPNDLKTDFALRITNLYVEAQSPQR